jgi:hypothetical protein
MKRKPFVFVSTLQRLPLHHKHYRHTTIETASIQESFHPSLRTGNSAIRFLYEVTLEKEVNDKRIPHAK